MCTKRKIEDDHQHRSAEQSTSMDAQKAPQSKLPESQQAVAVDDYIWAAMQNYAAELRAGNKPGRQRTS